MINTFVLSHKSIQSYINSDNKVWLDYLLTFQKLICIRCIEDIAMLHFSEQIWMKFECLTAFDLLKHDEDLPENAV